MENGGIDTELPDCELDNDDNINPSTINISDVIEVIKTTDPSFQADIQQSDMFSGGGPIPGPSINSHQSASSLASSAYKKKNAHVKIVEQPASKALRFRYECEGRSAGSIPGAQSTPENKTYPTIEIVGYRGRAVCVVSCVTKDAPYKAHPHNLVGKDCKKGVCTVEINSDSMCFSFSNLGIQCVKKKDIEEALRVREEIRVDPYKGGFSHRTQPAGIDLNAVRLCFQVFLEGSERGKFTLALAPVVSDVIYDKKAMSDLVICKMSHCTASVAGGQEVILLCEKVAKEDITIRFFEIVDQQLVWEGNGDFQHANVHKQVAIAFRTPRYRTIEVEQPVKVYIQLLRPSDNACSDPLPFELLPLESEKSKRKRTHFNEEANPNLLKRLQAPIHDVASMDPLAQPSMYNMYGMGQEKKIKMEPRDQPPSPYGQIPVGMYRSVQNSPSPQHIATPSPPLEYTWGHHILPHQSPTNISPAIPGPSYQNVPGPSYQNILHQNVAVPVQTLPSTENPSLSGLLNMDNIYSSELSGLTSFLEGAYQSNPTNMNRQENDMNIDQENMTNSFTRFVLNDLSATANMTEYGDHQQT